MESFFKTLKVERVYQVQYETRAQARIDVVNWIEGFYNSQRLHTSIDFSGTEYPGEDVGRCVKWCTSNRGRVKPASG
jgi:transposase InsO family protein